MTQRLKNLKVFKFFSLKIKQWGQILPKLRTKLDISEIRRCRFLLSLKNARGQGGDTIRQR